jgi:hypothetical protein
MATVKIIKWSEVRKGDRALVVDQNASYLHALREITTVRANLRNAKMIMEVGIKYYDPYSHRWKRQWSYPTKDDLVAIERDSND